MQQYLLKITAVELNSELFTEAHVNTGMLSVLHVGLDQRKAPH